MPLRATINQETILAPFMDIGTWKSLKQRIEKEKLEVRLPCCGNIAYLRTSKHGLHHFVHKERDNCTSAPETWQHLKAKHDIVLACHAAGYDALTEAAGDGWRADVLATKGSGKVAFEVQWSPQTWETTQQRQQAYKDAGIRGCWLFKRPPTQYHATREVPLFKIDVTEESATVLFNPHSYDKWLESDVKPIPLSEFIVALLTGKIRYQEYLASSRRQKTRIVFVKIDCWKCHRPYHVYYVHELKTGCEKIVEADLFAPQIIAAVLKFNTLPEGKDLKIGKIKERYSKTVGDRYMSFGCPYCDAICGDFFLRHEIFPEARYNEKKAPAILEKELDLDRIADGPYEHWCFPTNGEFCYVDNPPNFE